MKSLLGRPPVSTLETYKLLSHLNNGKAVEEIWFLQNLEKLMQNGSPLCWPPSSHILSAVSGCLNIGIIAVPIIKKGNKSNPAKFHLINLWNVLINQVSNVHVRNSFKKRANFDWLRNTFQERTSNYWILIIVNHPTEKYYSWSWGFLVAAFVDLKVWPLGEDCGGNY